MISSIFSVPDCHTERSGRLREQFEVPAPDQPSIVTYLLLQRPVSLPDWPGYVHRIETLEDAESLDDMSEIIRRVVTTRLRMSKPYSRKCLQAQKRLAKSS